MSGHITRIVASCGLRGQSKGVERLLEAAGQDEADALALLGDLGSNEAEVREYAADKSLHEGGSEVLAEMVKTYAPALVLTGGEGFHGEQRGTSLMVSPGTLSEGEYALVDLSEREVEEKKL